MLVKLNADITATDTVSYYQSPLYLRTYVCIMNTNYIVCIHMLYISHVNNGLLWCILNFNPLICLYCIIGSYVCTLQYNVVIVC